LEERHCDSALQSAFRDLLGDNTVEGLDSSYASPRPELVTMQPLAAVSEVATAFDAFEDFAGEQDEDAAVSYVDAVEYVDNVCLETVTS
jgi:hypothetical protein